MTEIKSIEEYIYNITAINDAISDPDDNENFLGKRLLFRGQANNIWSLLPGLGRMDSATNEKAATYEEKNMIEMAKNKMPDVFRKDMSPLELLALLQHYGMPTRLMDITENALVALFFACFDYSQFDQDGEVIVFRDNSRDVENYPIVQAAADSYNLCLGSFYGLEDFLNNALDQDYFRVQRERAFINHETDDEKAKWVKKCYSKIMYVYAPIRSTRQLVQDGRYILFPNDISEFDLDNGKKKLCFNDSISAIPKNHEDIVDIITIPHGKKHQLIKDLGVLGITKAKLFCDSPDELCKEIKERSQKALQGRDSW